MGGTSYFSNDLFYDTVPVRMSYKTVIDYWLTGSKKDLKVAQGLFKLKHYAYCLFFCHLALEKECKALFVSRHNQHAPFIHDLVILAQRCDLVLSKEQIKDLETITTFNIQGRYADYKSKFYKTFNNKKTAEFYLKVTQQLLVWLEKNFPKT